MYTTSKKCVLIKKYIVNLLNTMLKEKNLQYDDDVIQSKLQNIDIDTFSMSNNYYLSIIGNIN